MREVLTSLTNNAAFGALFYHANLGIIAVNNKAIIMLANPYAEKLFAYAKGELKGKSLNTLIPEDIRSKHAGYHAGYFCDPRPRPMGAGLNLQARKKNGDLFPVEISLSYFSLEDEMLAVAFIRDISEEQKANEKFYKLFQESPMGIVLSEANTGKMLDVNDSFCNMVGYTKAELIDKSSNEMGLYMQSSEREKLRTRIKENGKVTNYELEILTKKGDVLHVLLSAEMIELNNTTCFITTVLDVTETKLSAAKLNTSEENYRIIFNSMHDSFILQEIVRDKNKKIIGLLIIDVNPAAEQLLEKKREEIIGHMRNEFLGTLDDEMIKIIDKLDGTEEVFRFQQYISTLDKWFNRTLFSPKAGQIVGISEDITVQKKAQDALQKINEELEERIAQRTKELLQSLEREKELNEMKSRFVSTASHEFRTPLTAILSSMELIEAYSSDDQLDKRNKHIMRVKSSVKHLVDILNDFLSLEKAQHGKIEVVKQNFNLRDFAEDLISEIKGILKEGQWISFSFKGSEEIWQDKKTFRHILLNLLSNAVKYSDNNKEIEFTVQVKDSMVFIHIKDKGIGIPEEEQKNLFNNFFRASNAGNIQGTGLGLSIVKKYVGLLNGNISFVSIQNEGTTFSVELPIV
jgi:PAS domain S-box-containing protein